LKDVLPRGQVASQTYTQTYPVIRGIQAGREFYVTMMPMSLLATGLFTFTDSRIAPELRAQRILNKSRVPEIVKYLVNNPKDYVLSAVTASIDKMATFIPRLEFDKAGRLGDLVIPMDARFLINDGQHRRAAIEQAIKQNPSLAHETIPVVLFVDAGLKRSQQMFADLNKYAIRPTRSLGVLYDHSDPIAKVVRELIVTIDLFVDRVEKEATTISNRSKNLFTLSAVYQATMALLGKKKKSERITQEESKLVFEFWNELEQHIHEWRELLQGKATPADLRHGYVHASGVMLHAIGLVGRSLIVNYPNSWKQKLSKLEEVNWSKDNPIWEGRAMVGGRLSKTYTNVILSANYLKQILGIPLAPEEQKIESDHSRGQVVAEVVSK
jgi:DNA sulfur modification protein DndB